MKKEWICKMDFRRVWRTFRLWTSRDRSTYIRKANIFAEFGENSTMSSRKVPLYPELIHIKNNVRLAAGVSLIPHDMIHAMLNNKEDNKHMFGGYSFQEHMGCILIEDNVFVGANSTILAGVRIGSNCVIGAGSLVNKDLEGGYIYAGVPAKRICPFEDFVAKRMVEEYPRKYKRTGDSIDTEFAGYLWDKFCQTRDIS